MTRTNESPSSGWASRSVYVLLSVNAVLWAIMWWGFFARSAPYPTVKIPAEGAYTMEVVAHRAAQPGIAPTRFASYNAAFFPNLPSFIATNFLFNAAFKEPRPDLYLGTTVVGYQLICWMLLSFFQWYLVARLLIWLSGKGKPGTDGTFIKARRGNWIRGSSL